MSLPFYISHVTIFTCVDIKKRDQGKIKKRDTSVQKKSLTLVNHVK